LKNQNQNSPKPVAQASACEAERTGAGEFTRFGLCANAEKKPYTKPVFRFERVFETRALSCGKMQDTQESCHHNRRTS
jgi:hypothetical protein